MRSEREYWDRHARDYDRSMVLFGRPMPRMVELAAEAVRDDLCVLEVAAGTGLVTVALARVAREVVATDYSAAMVNRISERVHSAGLRNVRCEQADLYTLPFETGSFDAVVAANVLHLVPDLPRALSSLRRVLRAPRGRLIAPTYCHDETVKARLLSRLLAVSGFPSRRRFSARSLVSALEGDGLRLTRVEVIPALIPITFVEGTFDVA